MSKNKKLQLAQGVHCVFEILRKHPRGLTTHQLQQQLANAPYAARFVAQALASGDLTFSELTVPCVPAIKAGWLTIQNNRWSLSEAGRKAYDNYTDPNRFMSEAGKSSVQGWFAFQFPQLYSLAGRTKDQIASEVRAIRRIGLSRLLNNTFGEVEDWEVALPVQSPLTLQVATEELTTEQSLFELIQSNGLEFSEGGHAIYLPPHSFRAACFKVVAENYPLDAGIKIVKNEGGVDGSEYVRGSAKGDSRIHRNLVHSHRKLALVANLFYIKDVGPRLYDVVNLKCGERTWTGYVVQDVGQRVPSEEEWRRGLLTLRDMDVSGLIKVILPDGFEDEEFDCPSCSGNAFMDQNGKFRYIDFQNFRLGDYGKFLTSLAAAAAEHSHFGDTLLLRGNRYLYQSIPGVRLPAKRNVVNRVITLKKLFAEAGISVDGRLVLDVGCNIGMMMGQYLNLGAKWCHGWDRSEIVPHTERMLLALGCTRFSTTGADLTACRSLVDDLPSHVKSATEGCVVSYMAIRGHLDWLDDLGKIPWSFMIYEGHEGETLAELKGHLEDLGRLAKATLGPVTSYIDGDSEERMLAIAVRSH
ncbi:MAG: hypothetical protein ABR555_06510 [Pyrinomonadaceae bacterium]